MKAERPVFLPWTCLLCLGSSWQFLDADGSGLIDIQEFTDAVIGKKDSQGSGKGKR